jgi:hypothetical protein
VQFLPRANEDVLRELFRASAVGDHARAQGVHPVDVLPVQALEGLAIPGRSARSVRVESVTT